ncbi:helix-turn-helix domain-containing protein [Actinobacillus capsulatus]|uniref:helix-turn-helix domain-containing protein n=1 Tax=Actinobacillus capsulatus TaxID=717 RepID=UPI0012DD1092|nr:helix-turn-helix domain-containing protein [Actinobacillus capsulatus]
MSCPLKVGQTNQLIKGADFVMGKHYTSSFKFHVIQHVLDNRMGVREVADYFSISSHSSVVMWLQRFEKYGPNGLIRQPNIFAIHQENDGRDGYRMIRAKLQAEGIFISGKIVGDEKLYLSPMMDLANREIIAYHIGHRPNFALVANMLKKTLVQLKEDRATNYS